MAVHAHKKVAEIAHEFAGAVYDEMAKDNAFYALNPSRRNFCRRNAATYLPTAREIMVDMLARDDVSTRDKDEIFDALKLDRTIPRGASRILDA